MSASAGSPDGAAVLSCAEIDLGAIAANIRAIRAHVGSRAAVIAVVKANAYGHGMEPVARTALAAGAARLAVNRVMEGVQLRQAGIAGPILILGYCPPGEAAAVVAHDLTPAVGDPEAAAALAAQAAARDRTIAVHVKVDTGMGRFGLLPGEVAAFLDWVAGLPGLRVEGMFTHFATSDSADKTYVREQFAVFTGLLEAARAAGHDIPLPHVANSGAALDLPEMALAAVRPGLAIYGMYPSPQVSRRVTLRPALTIRSHVARVRTLPAGASIGYDRTYITPRPTPVALIPVGYGDGYPRFLTGQVDVLINGRRAPNVGRVAMDQFVVDISEVGPVHLDDEVILLGEQGGARITAEELAERAHTINYHITTALLPRLRRIYTGG